MIDSKIQKKSVIVKILERCKSLGRQRKGGDDQHQVVVVPEGYFVVHVGPGKERIVIRTKCLNHPLFKELLDEAECEYGYTCGGPIELPCDVDRFFTVLSEMDHVHSSPMCTSVVASPICGFGKGHAGYRVLTRQGRSRTVYTRPEMKDFQVLPGRGVQRGGGGDESSICF